MVAALLVETRQHGPRLSAWVRLSHGVPSTLVVGKNVIPSQSGFQQGDHLGPVLFALAVHPVVQAARCEVEVCTGRAIHLSTVFMDDGSVAGDVAMVAAWHAPTTWRFRDIWLEVNPAKC